MTHGQSTLFNYLKILIRYNDVLINYRPDWLFGMELDFYFPELNIAFEFQGHQHYAPSKKYGSCKEQKQRDKRKRKICDERKISLVTVDASELEYTRLIFKIKQAINRFNLDKNLLISPSDKKENILKLKSLNKLSIEYRKILRENYNDVTSYKKKSNLRKSAMREAYKHSE